MILFPPILGRGSLYFIYPIALPKLPNVCELFLAEDGAEISFVTLVFLASHYGASNGEMAPRTQRCGLHIPS
jgi:hypothetical protein